MNYNEIYPCIALIARGRIGKWWIHKEYKTYRVVTKYYVPDNPRSPSQQANRALVYDGVYNWLHFSDEVKNYYNKMRTSSPMSGYNRYLQLYLNATEPMIIYWDTLEKDAGDVTRLPDYMATDYFGGVGRIRSQDAYPASPPYGAIRFQPATNKFLGFKEDSGWGELGGAVAETPVDGWTPASEAWTYASASTITVPAGAGSKYAVGDKIKWTQTTVKYGVIVAVANTLLTIAVNTDYVVTDAAISLNYYSHELNPIGYPHWFTYTPTITWTAGTAPSGSPTKRERFSIRGRTCMVSVFNHSYTPGATVTGASVPLPVTASGLQLVLCTIPNGNSPNDTVGYVETTVALLTCISISANQIRMFATYQF